MTVILWPLLFAIPALRHDLPEPRLCLGLFVTLWAATVLLSLYGRAPFGMPEELELLLSAVLVPAAGITVARLIRPVLAPGAA